MTAAKDEYLVDAWQLGMVAFFMLTGVGSFGFKVMLLLIKSPKQLRFKWFNLANQLIEIFVA